jgi:predicted transcriptional regulator
MEGNTLDTRDNKIIDVFNDLGVPKNLAKTLMYISKVEECRSSEIEHGANLRQPEVSVAMQQLTDMGWISKRNRKKEGKGRPIYLYKMETTLEDVIDHYEQEKLDQINTIKKDLKELKELIDSRKKEE